MRNTLDYKIPRQKHSIYYKSVIFIIMQHSSYSHFNLYISMDTSSSTKQQFIPSPSSPFQLTSSQNRHSHHNNLHTKNVWSNKQKLQYSIFLCYFRDFFNNNQLKRVEWKIFKGMSRFIQTRNPQQCRSYHLKLINKFKDTKMFLKLFMRRITGIKEKIAKVEKQLELIQEEFEMYIEKNHSLHLERKDRQNNSMFTNACLKDCKISIVALDGKASKEEFIKTADDYGPQQSIIQSQIRPIHTFQSQNCLNEGLNIQRQQRMSLPSFDDERSEKMVIKG